MMGLPVVSRKRWTKWRSQEGDVLGLSLRRGNEIWKNVQPEVEILSKGAFGHHALQIPVSRRDDPDIGLQRKIGPRGS